MNWRRFSQQFPIGGNLETQCLLPISFHRRPRRMKWRNSRSFFSLLVAGQRGVLLILPNPSTAPQCSRGKGQGSCTPDFAQPVIMIITISGFFRFFARWLELLRTIPASGPNDTLSNIIHKPNSGEIIRSSPMRATGELGHPTGLASSWKMNPVTARGQQFPGNLGQLLDKP